MGWSSSAGWNNDGWSAVAASTFDAATTAWVSAVNAAAGSSVVGGTNKGIVDTLIKALKTAPNGNLFTLIDRLWIYGLANESTFEGLCSIVTGNQFCTTQANGGAFTLDANGFTGDGASYIDTGFNPTTATTPNFVTNSGLLGVYIGTTARAAFDKVAIGSTTTHNPANQVFPFAASGNAVGEICTNANVGADFAAVLTAAGFTAASRTGFSGATSALYRNTSTAIASAGCTNAVAPANANFYVAAVNDTNLGSPGPFQQSLDPHLVAVISGGMTAAQFGDLSAAVNAAMGLLGKSVY